MKNFRNEGWKFWDKMEDVNPDQTAGGGHVFSPLVATTPQSLLNVDDDNDDLASTTPAHVGGAASSADGSSGAAPASGAAAAAAATPNDGSSAATSGFTPTDTDQDMSSAATTSPAGGSSTLISSMSAPKGKKRRNESGNMAPPSKRSAASSSSRVSSRADSASTSGTKARTPSMNIMVKQMDNTVNHIMDLFKGTMVNERRQALSMLQAESQANNVEDGWSAEDVTLMVEVFSHHMNLAESYVGLEGPVRKEWVKRILDDLREQMQEGASMKKAVRSLGGN